MAGEFIKLDQDSDVSRITLDRTSTYNAVNLEMLIDLQNMIDVLEQFPPRVLVFRANAPGFCSGIDLKESREATSEFARARATTMHDVLSRLRRLPFPVITSIDGVAAGLGCELAISGDIRIASPASRFSYPEPRVAVPSPAYHLTNLIGLARTQDMLLTARWVDATEAQQWGLATKIAEKPDDEAEEVARELLLLSPISLSRTKENIFVGMELGAAAASDHHIEHVAAAAGTADRREALEAFAEKREPRFSGE